ncbi:MAG: sigma 54-interacting transcriptional regulator [Myxococcales bacterium]|nr:sigma 54-interacting transcriptional regulator [Myxococcales bacterium]MCB9650717.1 sigma 54-interacting transcriptional regulator [Deltaproteobacteria bacterium]
MPSVLLKAPDRPPKPVRLIRPVTTIGSSGDNDIHVDDAGLEPTHAQILREGAEFVVVGMLRDMTVNGRREKRAKLSTGDVVRFGNLELVFYANDADVPKPPPVMRPAPAGQPQAVTVEVVSAYKRVHEFSMKLLTGASTETLVETILDSIVELTGADKGFLVLLEDDSPVVRAARNLEKGNIQRSLEQLSDSIVRRVVETKKPLIVADALADEEWSASESVVSLKLHSVMCCPLMEREELKGLLYVGNNRVTNLFDDAALDVMNVFAAQASLLLSQARRIDELAKEKDALEEKLEGLKFGSIVGACDSMKEVFKRVRKVATADVSVLITGETGTGKELIAREIHENSRRAKGPFIVINCGAIPENLLESELFGHVRGAFTGAVVDKIGRFQAANGGTLFLDEIGEMPMALQVKLLRALQEHMVIRVGGTNSEKVDIRVVAATNRVLEREIKEGRFREDLYYRLNVVNVGLPPLRERADDLDILAKYFLVRESESMARNMKGFTKSCLVAMRKYRWPGNVRELENRIKKAVVLAERPLITADDLDIQESDVEEILSLADAKERFQTRYINKVLELNGGNRTKTARDLGVDPRTIFRHLEKTGSPIPPEDGVAGLELD